MLVAALVLAACSPAAVGPGPGPGLDAGFRDVQRAPDGRIAEDRVRPNDAPPTPDTGPVVEQEVAPPPITGGTLLVTRDTTRAVAADPDRDRVFIVDIPARRLVGEVALESGDEPGRLVEDDAGRVHVALRRGGAVVSIDIATQQILERRAVCGAPRGIAFDGASGTLHVACAGGELVSLPAAGGAPTRVLRLVDDLRDVIVQGGNLYVTRFRRAELLTIGPDGAVLGRTQPVGELPPDLPLRSMTVLPTDFVSAVAWRAVAHPGGGVMMLHQRATTAAVVPEPGGYGGQERCQPGILHSTVTPLARPSGTREVGPVLNGTVLAIDLAVAPDGTSMLITAPGNARLAPGSSTVGRIRLADGRAENSCAISWTSYYPQGEPTSAVYAPPGWIVIQTREPAGIEITDVENTQGMQSRIPLPGASREDTGHVLFHMNAGLGVACASCHPEGGDDGRTWNFAGIGPRRTQALRGGLLGTEPFHWDGDMFDFSHLADEVFSGRMGGGFLSDPQVHALFRWLDRQPTHPNGAPEDPASVARGQAIFHDPNVACASCHAGERFTNNGTVSVGTGSPLQVPSLRGLRWRAPYMHDGCAPTLHDRFGPCGGGDQHGRTSHLSPTEIDDLVAYLRTL